jgi:acyl-CoA hydrolase
MWHTKLEASAVLSGKRLLCAQGQFVLIAFDPQGKTTPVPEISGDSTESGEVLAEFLGATLIRRIVV